jgi:hypothetical protein
MLPVLLAEGHCEPSTYDPDAISRLQSRIRDDNSSKGLVNIFMQQKPHTERLYYDPFTFKSKDLAELEHRIDHDCRFVRKLDLHYPAQRYAGIHFRKETQHTVSDHIETIMKGRQLWLTRTGRFTTGSRFQKGDLLCVLHDCSHPVTLRRVPGKDTYTVVSTCYLEDWMDPWGRGKVDWKEEEADEFALV